MKKQYNSKKFHEELEAAGLEVLGVDSDGDVTTWGNGKTTEDQTPEIKAKLEKVKVAHNSTWYTEERRKAYPDLSEQLDMIWHDMENGTTTWRDAIRAIKQQYPKE